MSFALVAGVAAAVLCFSYGAITYVYRDAPRRGMDAGQWSGIVAVTLGTGLVAYLVLRDEPRSTGEGEERPGPEHGES